MKWIRLWPDFVINGTTFIELNAEQRGVWFSLLALAGYSPIPGTICLAKGIPYTTDQLIKILKLPENVLKEGITRLISQEKLMGNADGTISVTHWNRYQTEYERQKPYRGLHGKVTGKGYRPKLQGDIDIDIDLDKDKKKKEKKIKPSGNPAVAALIDYFSDQCETKKHYKPVVNGPQDGAMVKKFLKRWKEADGQALIGWFLESEKAERQGASLSVCFSAHSINLWQEERRLYR